MPRCQGVHSTRKSSRTDHAVLDSEHVVGGRCGRCAGPDSVSLCMYSGYLKPQRAVGCVLRTGGDSDGGELHFGSFLYLDIAADGVDTYSGPLTVDGSGNAKLRIQGTKSMQDVAVVTLQLRSVLFCVCLLPSRNRGALLQVHHRTFEGRDLLPQPADFLQVLPP